MLSRRDKLLVQPWEDRRFKDHRSKVLAALPAVDARAPAARPHVTLKLKKQQRELERRHKVQRDNFSLLQRLAAVVRARRLDNRWDKPLPNFHQKVGLYWDGRGGRGGRGSLPDPHTELDDTYSNVRCYACDHKRRLASQAYGFSECELYLPSIY